MLGLKEMLEKLLDTIDADDNIVSINELDKSADYTENLAYQSLRMRLFLDGDVVWKQEVYYNIEDLNSDICSYINN